MEAPIIKIDRPIISKERTILTAKQLGTPGLRMFGRHGNNRAIAALPPHYHPDCYEVTYLVHGNVHFSVAGQAYPLTGGETFVTSPDEIHDTGEIPMSLHEMYWFQLDVRERENFLFLCPQAADILLDSLANLPGHLIPMEDTGAGELLRAAFQHFQEDTPSDRILGAQLLGYFLLRLCSKRSVSALSPDIRKALDYIEQHLDQELPMEDLAEQVLLSESRFKQKFRQQVGIAPRDYVNFHKVEAAKQLLRKGCTPTQTANKLAFSSSSYFSTVFRRYAGCSPTQYRKKSK